MHALALPAEPDDNLIFVLQVVYGYAGGSEALLHCEMSNQAGAKRRQILSIIIDGIWI